MKQNLYLFFLFFSSLFFHSQNNSLTPKDIDSQIKKFDTNSQYDVVSKLEDLAKAAQEIDYKKGVVMAKMKILLVYYNSSDYKKSLEIIKEVESLEPLENETLASLYIYKYHVNIALGLEKEALKNIRDALKFAKMIKDPDTRYLKSSNVYNRLALYYDYKSPDSLISNLKKGLHEVMQLSESTPETRMKKYGLIIHNNINIGNYYVGVIKPMRLDLAEPYFLKAYSYRTTNPQIFELNAMDILKGIGHFYLEKKEYSKCIEMANEVIAREKKSKNPVHRLYGFQLLADANEELKNSKEQAKYTLLYAKLNDSLNQVAKKEVGREVNQIITNIKKEKDEEHNSSLKSILLSVFGFILIVTFSIWFYWRNKNKMLKTKYNHLIEKLNEEPAPDSITEIHEINNETESKAPIKISEETIKSVLTKMDKFEASEKFLKKDITLTWFANYLSVNPKYLSPIIKAHKNNNFNGYINKLRIDYIIRKLYENPVYREYKVSYLAEECGYASPQVFAIAFKKETELTPSYFIENLKNNN